jgi:hypothetical protein
MRKCVEFTKIHFLCRKNLNYGTYDDLKIWNSLGDNSHINHMGIPLRKIIFINWPKAPLIDAQCV